MTSRLMYIILVKLNTDSVSKQNVQLGKHDRSNDHTINQHCLEW